MPTERKLNPHEVTKILNWGKRWKRLKTRKQIAMKFKVSETTIKRIVEQGGYTPPKSVVDLDDLAKRCSDFGLVPRETTEGASESI